MDVKQRIQNVLDGKLDPQGPVTLPGGLLQDALAEIERLEKIEGKAKELYEYRQDAFPGILAAENMQLVLDGLESDLFPERFKDLKLLPPR